MGTRLSFHPRSTEGALPPPRMIMLLRFNSFSISRLELLLAIRGTALSFHVDHLLSFVPKTGLCGSTGVTQYCNLVIWLRTWRLLGISRWAIPEGGTWQPAHTTDLRNVRKAFSTCLYILVSMLVLDRRPSRPLFFCDWCPPGPGPAKPRKREKLHYSVSREPLHLLFEYL